MAYMSSQDVWYGVCFPTHQRTGGVWISFSKINPDTTHCSSSQSEKQVSAPIIEYWAN